MNEIINTLNFKYKILNNKLIIYKNFTNEKLKELLNKYSYDYVLDTLINYIETKEQDKKRKNLLGTSILNNFKNIVNNNKNIENNEIDIYYTNKSEVKELLKKLDETTIKKHLKLQ